MLKYLSDFVKNLEGWERNKPSSFWFCSLALYFSFSAGFGALFPESEPPRQSYLVIEQVRGGAAKDYPFLGKRKKFDLDFHRELEQRFPDCTRRVDYQKKQKKFFKSAMRKKREMKKVNMIEDRKFYTKEMVSMLNIKLKDKSITSSIHAKASC